MRKRRLLPVLAFLWPAVLIPTSASAQAGRVMENQEFQSSALDRAWNYTIYLPPGYETDQRAYPVVYLLHGYGGNHTNWVRLGDAAFTADSLTHIGELPPTIIVMPDGRNSWYVNSEPDGGFGAMETAMVEDLVGHVDATYRTIANRRGRMIAGLSMGGYGALHLAFKYPDLFGAAASLSGAFSREEPERQDLFSPAFGDPFDPDRWAAENPFRFIQDVKASGLRLPVYLTVGDDDGPWLYTGAVEFYRDLQEAEMPAELRITDGAHTWAVWDTALAETLKFFSDVFRAR